MAPPFGKPGSRTCSGEVECTRRSEPASAHDQNRARLNSRVAFNADIRHQKLARVALRRGLAERADGRSAGILHGLLYKKRTGNSDFGILRAASSKRMHRAAYVTVLAAAYLASVSDAAFVQPLFSQVGFPFLVQDKNSSPTSVPESGTLGAVKPGMEASRLTLDGLDDCSPVPCAGSVGC